jgi:hypothetical protein
MTRRHLMVAWLLCAWVLWQRFDTPIEGRIDVILPSWGVEGAAATETACEEWATRMKEHFRQTAPGVRASFICLPDTIDPRGPKK